MEIVKMPRLLVMTAASLMAFAGSATAAPVLTSPSGTEYTGTITASLEFGTSAMLKAGIEDTCTGATVSGTVSTNTESQAKGSISTGSVGSCTKNTTSIKGGEFTISSSGAVSIAGNEVTINDTALGISCVYGGGTGTTLGTLTGGTPAKLTVNTTKLQKISGSFFCASSGTFTANLIVTTPSTLLIT